MGGHSKHTNWVRTLDCCVCGDNTSTELAHVRYSEYKSGKVNPGIGKKPADMWTVPLCTKHHQLQHLIGERAFWSKFKINPIIYALLLHQHSGNIDKLPEIKEKSRIAEPARSTLLPAYRFHRVLSPVRCYALEKE